MLNTHYSFCSLAACADGTWPEGGFVQGSDGNFYGTTDQGGTASRITVPGCFAGCGTFFRITPSGALSTLRSFCLDKECPDGAVPAGSVVQLSNGMFYGTTLHGSDCRYNPRGGCGTVFSLSTSVALAPTFTPASLTFTQQRVGNTSNARSVTIKNGNTAAATLDFSGFTVSAPFAISANTCGPTLAAGKSCEVSITFTPTATGTAKGALNVSDNAPLSPQSVNLSGTGDWSG